MGHTHNLQSISITIQILHIMSDTNLSLDEIIKKKNIHIKSQDNLSLDEIIKKKNIQPFTNQNTKVKRLGNKLPLKTNATTNNKVTDVRNKIIQNKKLKMGDAREYLGKLARNGDARERLNKLKQGKFGVAATRLGPQNSIIKTQFGLQTRRNGLNGPVRKMQMNTQNSGMMQPDIMWETRYPEERIYRPPYPVVYVDEWDVPVRQYVDEWDVPMRQYVDEWDGPVRQRPVYMNASMRRPAPIIVQRTQQKRPPVFVKAPMS